jgi:hypothetical protein
LELPYLCERLYRGEIAAIDALLNLYHLDNVSRSYRFLLASPVRCRQ